MAIMRERVEAMQAIWTQAEASYEGEHVRFDGIWCDPKPAQRPYPPMWVAGNVELAGRRGLNFIFGAPIDADLRRRYDELWAAGRDDPERLNPHVDAPLVGSSQYLCIAKTDAEARRIGERALGVLGRFLGRSLGHEPPHLQDPDRPMPPTPLVKAIQAGGTGGVLVCGSPQTVREHYVRYAAEGNANYIVINVPFGDMTPAEAEYTLDAFIAEVMPAVRAAAPQRSVQRGAAGA
jgi:alkanesulfonate monooxygenase SsuD/methylene tetrahydromethanopterin reductase-like flavin-dependent oxidoreductase (luciferase family)